MPWPSRSSKSRSSHTLGASSPSKIPARLSILATIAQPSCSGLRKPINNRRWSGLISRPSTLSPPAFFTSRILAAAAKTANFAVSDHFKPVVTLRSTSLLPSTRNRTSFSRAFTTLPSSMPVSGMKVAGIEIRLATRNSAIPARSWSHSPLFIGGSAQRRAPGSDRCRNCLRSPIGTAQCPFLPMHPPGAQRCGQQQCWLVSVVGVGYQQQVNRAADGRGRDAFDLAGR